MLQSNKYHPLMRLGALGVVALVFLIKQPRSLNDYTSDFFFTITFYFVGIFLLLMVSGLIEEFGRK